MDPRGMMRRQSSGDRDHDRGGRRPRLGGRQGSSSSGGLMDVSMDDVNEKLRRSQDEMMGDDNAAPDSDVDEAEEEKEEAQLNPLLLALDDLEGRVVSVLNDFKSHPGRASDPSSMSIHDELGQVLRPVLEIAAHLGPSTGRSLASTYKHHFTVEGTIDEIYQRLNSDLVLPVVLETAQSDTVPAKRAAALKFFHELHREYQKAGSYLDASTAAPTLLGPYGPGALATHTPPPAAAQTPRALLRRRTQLKSTRRAELLRYWVQSAIPNLAPGAFTSVTSDAAAASRGVLSASASLKPSLRHMAERIGAADDAGALRLFRPVMIMIGGVLRRLFLDDAGGGGGSSSIGKGSMEGDALRSACVKFLEIVVLCFSNKVQPGAPHGAPHRRGKDALADDFSLEDLPTGHPIITRESLEEIGEYAFTTLRGLTTLGGQARIDPNLARAALTSSAAQLVDPSGGGGASSSPTSQIVAIIKPAALAYLEIESSVEETEGGKFPIDRQNIELDFPLSQKSYSLTINAVSMLATKRPVFFRDSATCLARRTVDPPKFDPSSSEIQLTKAAATGIFSHLKASCLTLLRHSISVTSGGWEVLHRALSEVGMKIQADKALNAAKQQHSLMTGGRSARNRAAMFYQWDQSADDSRVSKRQRETDDALAKIRAAKAARGLGNGIQLPTSMVDACELILLNLQHLPEQRPGPPASAAARKRPMTLDFITDAITTNGASLSSDESRWFDRDGGAAWSIEMGDDLLDGKRDISFKLDPKALQAARVPNDVDKSGKEGEESDIFDKQCKAAASQAFSRIVLTASNARSKSLVNLGNQITAKLAWTLRGVQPSAELKGARDMAMESLSKAKKTMKDTEGDNEPELASFADEYPLVSSCLALDMVANTGFGGVGVSSGAGSAGGSSSEQRGNSGGSAVAGTATLANRVLNEAYLESFGDEGSTKSKYEKSLDLFISSIVNACERANEKPNDNERKRVAAQAASSLPQQLAVLPSVTPSALTLASSLCDIEAVSKKAAEAARKGSHHNLAASAAAHAAKAAAEKRATAALLTLRDAAFQRNKGSVRRSAVDCAVAIAAGRLPGSPSVEEKALKLVMNVLFPKSANLADAVVASATEELERAASYAIENHEKIQQANETALAKKGPDSQTSKNALLPQSDEEKAAMERVRKPAVLFMALCVRRPDIIKVLMGISCREGARVLSKAVRTNMPKLARAASTKHGAASIALRVSDMVGEKETTLLLSFLDNLAPKTDNTLPSQELIDACHEIQKKRLDEDGKKDPRFIIPIVSGMKRQDLVNKLPEFVAASDTVFKAALMRMCERVGRHALMFRDEPDKEKPSLNGMTLCEQMVFLHRLDFSAVGLPQKRYLEAIRICLEEDEIFTDRVVMAALDYISGTFLSGDEHLPLAYMRTIILTCSKHESLHSWICHVLLPRLIEGKVYTDRRQWEGWMRCAKMLENTGDNGVSSIDAISKLPEEQLRMYRAKYPRKA